MSVSVRWLDHARTAAVCALVLAEPRIFASGVEPSAAPPTTNTAAVVDTRDSLGARRAVPEPAEPALIVSGAVALLTVTVRARRMRQVGGVDPR